MERAKFKERMKALKAYKNETGKGYWDWKVLAFDGGGDVELIGEKEIQWFKDWYNKRMEYAIANNRPDIVKQLESLQYYFYPEPYKYSLGVPWDNSIYTSTLEPKINRTKISINDQAIKDYLKEHGVKIGGYLHPEEGIVLPSNYNSSDLLHELAHIFNSSESITNAVNAAISDENGFVSFSKGLQNSDYWISPWEVHSRLMQFRKENNIDPIKVYNEEDIKQLRKSAKDERLFEIFDDSQMMHLLNDVAHNATTSTDDRLFLKNGGVVPAYTDGTDGDDEEVVEERPRMTPNPNIMGNVVKFWYGNRLKQKQYSDQVGDVKKFYDLFDNSSRLTPEKFYEVHKGRPWNMPDKHASDYYKAQDMAGGAIPNKGVWSVFSASGPQGRVGTMYHEGVGHIMGDLTPGILQVETPTLSNPYPDIYDYDYAGYINQTNEKFAETWAFRAMNWNMKDANGNYYIDPNRQLTEEEILEMIDNGAEIPKQWQKATPFEISYMHNTFAENDSKTDDYVFAAKDGGMVPAYGDGTDGDDDLRAQVINRANEVASNYDNAKDFDLSSVEYGLRKLAKNLFGRGGISNCTLSATGWIDPNNQYMSARNIFNNPNSGYVEIDKEYALPGDLLISKNPEKDSYHTMLIEGFNNNEPLLRYSRGGHDTEENLVKNRPLTEYHRLDNEQGGNHIEDHYFRYMLPNDFWLPEITITAPRKIKNK